MATTVRGTLLIIGGAEDKEGPCTILKRFVELSGGRDSRISIMAMASEKPKEVGEVYSRVFHTLRAGRIDVIQINRREEAVTSRYEKVLLESTGIFFSGGDQLRITSIIGGTRLDEIVHRKFEEGVVVAGTSAGASAMSDFMIVDGSDENPPKKCTTKLAPGMGFLEECVVDQHFAQRGRIGRLLAAVAQNPYILGIGIDEDTAIELGNDQVLTVIGSQSVTIIDGRSIRHSNTSEQEPDKPLALTDVLLHVLPVGYGFDLRRRRPVTNTKNVMMHE